MFTYQLHNLPSSISSCLSCLTESAIFGRFTDDFSTKALSPSICNSSSTTLGAAVAVRHISGTSGLMTGWLTIEANKGLKVKIRSQT